MVEIASKSQLRMSFLRWALFVVPALLLLGWFASQWSGAGMENRWYAALAKPDWTPAPLVFPIVWNILYIMMGLSLAMILNARGAAGRRPTTSGLPERRPALLLNARRINAPPPPLRFHR